MGNANGLQTCFVADEPHQAAPKRDPSIGAFDLVLTHEILQVREDTPSMLSKIDDLTLSIVDLADLIRANFVHQLQRIW